jgi:hypothetical protein
MNSASLCSLAGRYDNPIFTRFLAPIDCLKIPALQFKNTTSGFKSGGLESRFQRNRRVWFKNGTSCGSDNCTIVHMELGFFPRQIIFGESLKYKDDIRFSSLIHNSPQYS